MRMTERVSPSQGWGTVAVAASVVLGMAAPGAVEAQITEPAETQVVVHDADSRPSHDWEVGGVLLGLG